MSTFEVKVVKIDSVENHPDADRLSINRIKGYVAISNKLEDGSHRYSAGDLVVYIPSDALLPKYLLQNLDMWDEANNKGFLNGPEGNRVGPKRLRGIFSEGIIYKLSRPEIFLNQDLAETLKITKYEPVIPTSMSGQVFPLRGVPVKFDIEAYEKYPDIITEGDEVTFTEKCHGTFTGIGFIRGLKEKHAIQTDYNFSVVTYSKGLGAQGLVFKDCEENANNIYIRMAKTLLQNQDLCKYIEKILDCNQSSIHLLGETFGPGVQDLHYGLKQSTFRLFDVAFADNKNDKTFLGEEDFNWFVSKSKIDPVPLLYSGPFSMEKLLQYRDGKDFSNTHVREGIVIRPKKTMHDDRIGRVILKAVSPDYKLRKNKNATEYN